MTRSAAWPFRRQSAASSPPELRPKCSSYTLVPEMPVGRNRLPEGEAVEFFPPQYRSPILIRQLPEVDNPTADAELLAIRPDIYVDYGTVHEDYVASSRPSSGGRESPAPAQGLAESSGG